MSWRKVKLGDLVENFSVRAKDYGGSEGLDFCGVSNEEGIIKTKYAAEDKAEDYKIIEKGCFAYNPYRVNVGSIGLVTEDFKGLISPAYVVFKPKPNKIIPELLLKFLKSDEGLRQIRFYGRGTVRQALRFEDLCNIELSIPDFSEQIILFKKLINSQEKSNILSSELYHQLDLVKKLRQQFLQEAVQGKLVPQNSNDEPASELLKKIKAEKQKLISEGKLKKEKELLPIKPEEIPFEIPDSWIWCRLGKIAYIKRGKSPNYSDNGVQKMLNQKCVRWYDLDLQHCKSVDQKWFDNIAEDFRVNKNDVLVNSTGDGTIGRSAIANNDVLGYVFDSHILKISSTINQKYICFYINSDFGQSLIEKLKGATSTKQTELGVNNLANLIFPLPPLNLQHRIVQKLDELMQTCDALEASIKESASQNEKLLQQVLREALRKEEVELY